MAHCDGKTIGDGSDDDKSSDNESDKTLKLNKIDKKQPIALNDILSSLNNLSISCYIKLLNFNKLHGSCDTNALSHFCRMPALVDFPIAFISSELIFERFYHTLPSVPHNTSLVSKPYMKNPLFFQLGIVNDSHRHSKSPSFGTSPTRISEFTGSLVRVTDALSYERNAEKSVSNLPEKSVVSYSSTNSSSYISTSSPSSTLFIKGVIYSIQKNGSVCFLFKEGEDSTIYTANSHKIDSSNDIDLDHLYVFHRLKGSKKPDYVGKMTVLNQLVLKPNMSRLVEMEFVLFGVEENNRIESQGVSSSTEKSKGFSTKIPKLFKSNHQRNKSTSNVDYQNIQIDDLEFIDHIHMKHGFEPNLEKVAIVVKSSSSLGSEKKVENGGWGLKFLEKATIDGYIHTKKNCETGINVLIPSGFHGYPTKGGKGPSTLIKRWKSNGSCDCGGWDIGCPITELNNDKSSQENCKSAFLFKKGTKHVEPAWKMINTGENAYTMYFQPSLSGLEAFSIGLAIIHAQTPSLY